MNVVIALIVVEMLAVIMLLPLKVKVQGYFSLTNLSAGIDVKLLGIVVLKVRLKSQGREILLSLNGKNLSIKEMKDKLPNSKFLDGRALKGLTNALKAVKSGEISVLGGIVAVVGDSNPQTCAIACGVIESVFKMLGTKVRVYTDFETQRADADMRFGVKISLLQVITAFL